jgi:hypothetical protein
VCVDLSSPEKIENVLVRSKFVAMLFVYGNSLKSSLVCVVVPDPDVTKAWAKENLHIEVRKAHRAVYFFCSLTDMNLFTGCFYGGSLRF